MAEKTRFVIDLKQEIADFQQKAQFLDQKHRLEQEKAAQEQLKLFQDMAQLRKRNDLVQAEAERNKADVKNYEL